MAVEKSKVERPSRPVTLKDVAEAANVSTAAVSRVLHGGGSSVRVSEVRAEQIRAVAERMNYRVNAVARNLRMSKSHTIGVLFENLKGLSDGPLYITYLLDGVSSVLFKNGYRLSVLAEVDHDNVIGSLGDGQMDGVIWCKLARDEETINLIRKTPIPIVALNAAAPEPGSDVVYVNCDNEGGMELAVAHLWDLGHRNIAFVHEWEERNTPDCIARLGGYEAAIKKRGGTPFVTESQWFLDSVPAYLQANNCTAAVGWTESVADRLLQRLSESGIEVPAQMSVVGFDSTLYCETTTPRLTAVRQPIREMAAFATQALLDLISGRDSGQFSKIFPCTFDVRGSTAIYLNAEESNEP